MGVRGKVGPKVERGAPSRAAPGWYPPLGTYQDGVPRPADRHVGGGGARPGEADVVGRERVEAAVGAGVGGGCGMQQVVLAGRVEHELLAAADLREPRKLVSQSVRQSVSDTAPLCWVWGPGIAVLSSCR